MNPLLARLFAAIFLCGGIFALYEVVHTFTLGGYWLPAGSAPDLASPRCR